MKVILAQAMGMCFGVRDALAAARQYPTPTAVTVFGQLVHNPLVTRELDRRGFAALDETDRAAADVRTPAILITAHGISDRERHAFLATGKRLIDTTCPLVKRAHAAAVALARDGFFVVVVGKRGHVEVRGLTGDLPADRFAVVETPADVRHYAAGRIGVLAQTTSLPRDAREIVTRVEELNRDAQVRFVNTICAPTRERQAALSRLLEEVDVLVVVGGKHSNNTRQLVVRAREKDVRALHVEDAGDLQQAMFSPDDVVGLTAGTSTLPETIEAVREKLAHLHGQHDLAGAHVVWTREA